MQTVPVYERRDAPRPTLTLAELLVVVAIIGILAAILFPAFAVNHRPSPRAVCQWQLRSIGQALAMYASDWNDRLPPDSPVPALLDPYLKQRSLWRCPRDGNRRDTYDGTHGDTTVSYGYNWLGLTGKGAGVKLADVARPANTVAFAESTSCRVTPPALLTLGGAPLAYRHSSGSAVPGMVVAWADGHVTHVLGSKIEQKNPAGAAAGIGQYRYWDLR